MTKATRPVRGRPGVAVRTLLATLLASGLAACSSRDGADTEPEQGSCEPNTQAFVSRPTPSPATLPFLHVSGTDVVDESGQRVALRGVNLGSWLLVESWIPGIGIENLDCSDWNEVLIRKCEELGCERTMRVGVPLAYLQHFVALEPCARVAEFLRGWSTAHAISGEAEAIGRFWEWYDSTPKVASEQELWRSVAGRFGWRESQRLRETYRERWITEDDLARIAALGLSFVRLPFWYDWLESDDAAGARFRPEGWARLHQILEWARAHRLYVLLDMHGAPGGQNNETHSGTSDGNRLWFDERCSAKTARLWQAIASYVADDPHVVGFDLLNEPLSIYDAGRHQAVLSQIYQAIRAVDGRHIVMNEDGYLPLFLVPSPVEMGWENFMFSIHFYGGGTSADQRVAELAQKLAGLADVWDRRFRCPLLLGEFSTYDPGAESIEAMRRSFALLDSHGIHWSPWTYKQWDASSIWGLYHAKPPFARLDLASASLAETRDWIAALGTEHFETDPAFEAAYREQAPTPARPFSLDFE